VGEQLSRRVVLGLGVTTLAYGLVGCGGQAAAHPRSALAPAPVPVRSRPVFVVHDLLPQAPADAVALTIDDGPHPTWTPRVLDLLAREQVAATFSVVGAHARAFPALVQRIVAEGHGVCNHTLTHPEPFARRPAAEIDRQVVQTQAAIGDATGMFPHLFRSPGGGWSSAVFATAARHGLVPIDWDIDPRDWARPGVAAITRRLLRAKPGDILLCHDGGGNRAQTYTALTRVLPELKSRGLSFVTL
jgi:peptidoglycan/xylan/chitin deacetylase (PgdA/CDA1 family)